MFRNFNEIEKHILNKNIVKRIALCGAHDDDSLSAVVDASRKGVITSILIGDESKIREILRKMDEPDDRYEIINQPREKASAKMAVDFVNQGRVDIPMKGLMQSSSYMMPILDPVTGLVEEGGLLSSITIFYYPARNQFMLLTDPALNISPSFEEKIKLVNNAVKLARSLGFDKIKVAALSALEKINPDIIGSVDAGKLAEMEWDENIFVAGPFALDNAMDSETAKSKGITHEVAGNADVLLAPEICSGNVLHKAIHYFANLPSVAAVGGSKSPVIFNSRSDSTETKYYSILTAILQSQINQ